jgi:hypothetical protein
MIRMMYIVYRVHGVHYEYVGMSFVFSRSTKKILLMQRQARRVVFIAVRLFGTDKKATKLNRAIIFTESQVCFSKAISCEFALYYFQKILIYVLHDPKIFLFLF